jgi:hypothetical protein
MFATSDRFSAEAVPASHRPAPTMTTKGDLVAYFGCRQKRFRVIRIVFLLLAFGSMACPSRRCLAQEGGEVLGDGDKGATIGTLIYNTLSPAKPLPIPKSDDEALKKTMQNLGAGQSLKDAWKNGAASAAGFEDQEHSKSAKSERANTQEAANKKAAAKEAAHALDSLGVRSSVSRGSVTDLSTALNSDAARQAAVKKAQEEAARQARLAQIAEEKQAEEERIAEVRQKREEKEQEQADRQQRREEREAQREERQARREERKERQASTWQAQQAAAWQAQQAAAWQAQQAAAWQAQQAAAAWQAGQVTASPAPTSGATGGYTSGGSDVVYRLCGTATASEKLSSSYKSSCGTDNKGSSPSDSLGIHLPDLPSLSPSSTTLPSLVPPSSLPSDSSPSVTAPSSSSGSGK